MSNSLESDPMSRRTLLKTVGATGATAAGMHAVDGTRLDPVGEADAIAPVVVAGAAVAGAAVVGWAVREYEVVGSDSPADGLSGSALQEQFYNTVETRASTNASTFVDNQNLIDTGLLDAAYGDGKVAAIEAINNGQDQSTCISEATTAVDNYETTVVTNLINTWNESVDELSTNHQAAQDHPDINPDSIVTVSQDDGGSNSFSGDPVGFPSDGSYTLADGSTIAIRRLENGDRGESWSITGKSSGQYVYRVDASYDGRSVTYLTYNDWNGMLTSMESTFQTARDNVTLWVQNVYSEVQSGDLDTSQLLTSDELAAMTTDNSDFNQAVADLAALNISTDTESQVTINPGTIDAEIPGQLATTGDTTFTAGSTVDPTADGLSYYFTYDTSVASGNWSDYQTGIDGGTVTFTSEPYPSSQFNITTNQDETATVATGDLQDQGDGTWTVDISDQLETDIADISSVQFSAQSSETNYQTIQLQDPFDVVSITDSSGSEVDESSTTSPEPHDDNNYITQEEWNTRLERQEELIDEYQESGGGGGFLSGFGGESSIILLAGAAGAAYLFGR